MPGRSPHRRNSPPPAPHISRRSPPRGRVHSPERHHSEMSSSRARIERREFRPVVSPERHHSEMSSSRARIERREFRPVVRRSRSPPPKQRSFSPPLKRKPSPVREREMPRRAKVSKSPVGSRGGPERYSSRDPDPIAERSNSRSERFRDGDYVEEKPVTAPLRTQPQFRGPEGAVDFALEDLKKFTVEIHRRMGSSGGEDHIINRTVTNPDHVMPLRRPDEGSRPIFNVRAEVSASSIKDRATPPEEYRRVVNINTSRSSAQGYEQDHHSREKVRYASPGPAYEDNHRKPYFHERERSPYESRRRTPPREEYIDPREKRERQGSGRDEVRVREVDNRRREEVEVRRRDERPYSNDRASYDRESDLRSRLNERRIEARPEERDTSARRYEVERRTQHSPPPRDRRRPASAERHEGSRSSRAEGYEREKESRRRERPNSRERGHSREREERGERGRDRERYEHSEHYQESDKGRRSQNYKTDFEPPKKYYKNYEEKEFIPGPVRGRGGPPIRRGMPPMMRGRGAIRGVNRGFRGGMMPRGVPRAPFIPMRGFPPPPRFFPPY